MGDDTLPGFVAACAIAFTLAFGIGANDVANSFGTSVGSRALTMRQAIIIAAVCEILGAASLGSAVSNKLVQKISNLQGAQCWNCNVGVDNHQRSQDMFWGMLCAMVAGSIFLLGATHKALPVSTTHAVVGAVLGMSLLSVGPQCVLWGWDGLIPIILSWFISPVLAGVLSAVILLGLKQFVLQAPDPIASGLRALPFLYGGSVSTLVMMVLLKAHATRGIPLYQVLIVATAIAAAVVTVVQYALVPYVTKRLQQDGVSPGNWHAAAVSGSIELLPLTAAMGAASDSSTPPQQGMEADGAGAGGGEGGETEAEEGGALGLASDVRTVDPVSGGMREAADGEGSVGEGETVDVDLNDADAESHLDTLELEESVSPAERLFRYLQVTTACGMSFAHGANDTANAAGPFAAMQAIFLHGSCAAVDTPLWVLLAGGVGITLGFATFGHRVLATVGKSITRVNYSRGFSIELGATMSVVVASVFGLPVSSTHCLIGSVVFVGTMESGMYAVNWGLLSRIFISWVVTVPAAALLAALFFGALQGVRVDA